jgi:hypothetical protein
VTCQVALEFALTLEEEVRIGILLDAFAAIWIDDHQLKGSRLVGDFAALEADETALSFEETDHRMLISVVSCFDLRGRLVRIAGA